MSQFYPPAPVARTFTGPITDDVPCRRCQYNLRGLDSSALCPECGSPVELSIKGDLIRHSDPQWIARLVRGANWSFWVVIIVAAYVVFFAWNAFRHMFGPDVTRGFMFTTDLFAICAVWLLTTPDPSGIGESEYASSRKIARYSSLVPPLQLVLVAILADAHLPPTIFLSVMLLACCARAVGPIGFIAQMQYLSKLALRIPEMKLAKQARELRYTFGIPNGISVLLSCWTTLARAFGVRTVISKPGLTAITGIAGLCILIFGISYMVLLHRLNARLREQHALSERSWAGTVAPPNDIPPSPV
jgi:hypothetical protein